MSERHIVVSYTPGSPIGLRVMPPDSDRPVGDSGALREAADMLAPTEAPAPSQDTLRAAADAWVEAVQALAWCLDNTQQSTPSAMAYVASHNPYRAALAATTPEATGRDGVEG